MRKIKLQPGEALCGSCDGEGGGEYDTADSYGQHDSAWEECETCEGRGKVDAEPNVTACLARGYDPRLKVWCGIHEAVSL